MSGYGDDGRPRPRRERKPRFDESDSDSVDDYPPPKPRDSRRQRPGPDRDGVPSGPRPARRPSILVDPEETGSQRAKRRPRANSNVRLQTSDDESDDYGRNRARPDRAARGAHHDVERKLSPEHKQFRDKRDGYESEEGEMHKKAAPRPRPRAHWDDDDDDDDARSGDPHDRKYKADRPRKDPRDDLNIPGRGKSRDNADAAAAGAAGAAALAANPRLQRRRTYKGDDRDPRYDDRASPPRREDSKYLSAGKPSRGDDRGYRSDNPPPRRPERRRDDHDNFDDPRDRRRRDDGGYRSDRGGGAQRPPRPQDYYSDHRDDRAARRSDPRDSRQRDPARDRYREDDRYRDHDRRRMSDYDRPKSSKRGGGGGGGLGALGALGGANGGKWQKDAGAAFMTYAMPVIRKEGTRYLKKEMQKFLSKQGGGL